MWTKEAVRLLLELYEQHEHLYDTKHKDYKDYTKRSKSMFTICEGLKEQIPKITINDIRLKVHTIRSQYIKEKRLINESKQNTTDPDDIYEPKLWFYPLLQFLDPHAHPRPSSLNRSVKYKKDETVYDPNECLNTYRLPSPSRRSAIYSSDSSNDENDCNQSEVEIKLEKSDSNDSESLVSQKRSRRSLSRIGESFTQTLQDQMDELKRLLTSRKDEKIQYEWLGQQVVCEINNLKNEEIQRDTAWKIQSVIREAILEDVAFSNSK